MRWSLETVTFTEWDADGFLGVQLDPQGDGSASEIHQEHAYGFLGRPCDPDATKVGCYGLKGRDGSEGFCWFAHDPRSNAWLPRVTKGGSAQYGGTVGRALTWREIDGETGSITDYVPTEWDANGLATKAHKFETGLDGNGDPIILLQHSEGMVVELLKSGVLIADATGKGWVSVKDGSVTVSGTMKLVGALDIGGEGGVPVVLHTPLAAALGTFCTKLSALLPATGAPDSGAAIAGQIISAAGELAAALAGTASTVTTST